jgi:hypothetical protein
MKKDTEPHLWPTWKLSPEEADTFYRGSGRVTIAVDENSGLLGVVYHSHSQTKEVLQLALAQMNSNFPHAVTFEGSMRGHHFCEDLPDAGWRQVWKDEPPPQWPQAQGEGLWSEATSRSDPEQEPERDRDIDIDM